MKQVPQGAIADRDALCDGDRGGYGLEEHDDAGGVGLVCSIHGLLDGVEGIQNGQVAYVERVVGVWPR